MNINQIADQDIKDLGINLLGGVLVILLDRIYLFLRKVLKSFKFKMLFGHDISKDFYLIYGKMLLKQLLNTSGKVESFPYMKSNGKKVHQFRISEIVSFTETKSVKYISDSFARNTEYVPTMISDEELNGKLDVSYCSLGGYNNKKTIEVLESENNHYFNIDISEGAKIVSKNDQTRTYSIDELHDYAVIIKIRNKQFPKRTQICVAGLGESGTSGAAWFLANKWQTLLRKAIFLDFGCVIRVQFGKDESAEVIDFVSKRECK